MQKFVKLKNVEEGSLIQVYNDEEERLCECLVFENYEDDLYLHIEDTDEELCLSEIWDDVSSETLISVKKEDDDVHDKLTEDLKIQKLTQDIMKDLDQKENRSFSFEFPPSVDPITFSKDYSPRLSRLEIPRSIFKSRNEEEVNPYLYAHPKIKELILESEEKNEAKIDEEISTVQLEIESVKQSGFSNAYDIENINDKIYDLQIEVDELKKKEDQKEEEKLNYDLQQKLNQELEKNKGAKTGGASKLLGNFKDMFGKVHNFAYAPSHQALAIRKGITKDFIVYKDGQLTDVQDMVLDFDVPAFRMPVKESDVKKNDIVFNNGAYQYVEKAYEGYLQTIDPVHQTRSTVMPTKNLFMADAFYTVVRTMDFASQNGMDPMFLMAVSKGKSDDLLPFLMMSGGLGGKQKAGELDPMMLMMMKDKTEDMLPFLFMQQSGVSQDGFNPLMMLMMDDKESSSDLLPLMMMQQGNQSNQGGFNPMMMLAMKDGNMDMKDMMMMQAMSGNQKPVEKEVEDK